MSESLQVNLGKVTNFGGYSYNGLEVINLLSWDPKAPPPPASPNDQRLLLKEEIPPV